MSATSNAGGRDASADLRDIRVVQAGENMGFPLEPRQPVWICGESFRQDLQRHLAVELSVGGLVDLAHPAFADFGGDIVVAESGADLERYGLSG